MQKPTNRLSNLSTISRYQIALTLGMIVELPLIDDDMVVEGADF